MKIRTKLILNYSILSAMLLLIFSMIIVAVYINYRQVDFNKRLHNRAMSSVNMLFHENSIDSSMLQVIDNYIITTMIDLEISIFDSNNVLIYSNKSNSLLKTDTEAFSKDFLSLGSSKISFAYKNQSHEYTVVASAYDKYGISELRKIVNIIILVYLISIVLIVGFGFYNAIWSLRPFRRIVEEVESLDPANLKMRLPKGSNDEILQLTKAFNKLLDRIEQAFETEKSYISNASHELRTPVTLVLGQIEVALNKTRNEEEYTTILQSVYEDTTRMATIINGFLELAEANLDSNALKMTSIRIDELLFSLVDDFKKRKPTYFISVDFVTNPENDKQIECVANERLLSLMFGNLIDNACKYSGDKKAHVKIDFDDTHVIVSVIDYGIGIQEEDIVNIYKPMFRGKNSVSKPGHGIGLSIVKRIIDFHTATIDIKSGQNVGTTVIVRLKQSQYV